MTDPMPLLPGLSPVAGKSLTAKFAGGRLLSEAGVTVLHEDRAALAEAMTAPLVDAIRRACSTAAPIWSEPAWR